MLSWKKCIVSINNSHICIYVTCFFLLILVLGQGCSTQNQLSQTPVQPSVSQTQVESLSTPKLVIEKTSYDFGEIRPGSKNTATFRFSNVGDELLQVTDVKKCCGAVIKLDKEELASGESGVLTAQYQAGQGARRKIKQKENKGVRYFFLVFPWVAMWNVA